MSTFDMMLTRGSCDHHKHNRTTVLYTLVMVNKIKQNDLNLFSPFNVFHENSLCLACFSF